jgi:3'-phosphoadenosine 5'-phosphosulfate sulfotransferase (PAPS reductase)/FAD synthetase
MADRHVLGISGGKDSAALALYMANKNPELSIEYFFTDTGNELPEVYEFLNKLEAVLGKTIKRLNPQKNFEWWLKTYNHFLPSPQQRWCTINLKLVPFEKWVSSFPPEDTVYNYVAIRYDERSRKGLQSSDKRLITVLPFVEAGIDKEGVYALLNNSPVKLPKYYEWRSRSGCTFCFYQQKIEWVRLLERHPEDFEYAKSLEKNSIDHGSPFTWSQGESLEELSQPERIESIKKDYEKRVERLKRNYRPNPLLPNTNEAPIDNDELFGDSQGCNICHK